MKTLLATASALALLMTAAACGSESNESSDITVETPSASTDTTTPAAPTRQMYTLAAGEHEASDLLGASVHDATGKEISIVEDIWLASKGSEAMLVLRNGGVAGVGGDLRTVAFGAATFAPSGDTVGGEPNVIVSLTEASLEALPKFEQTSADDYRLASEMMGATMASSQTSAFARINDLIISESGETVYAVISADTLSIEQIVVDPDLIMVAEGDTDGDLVLDLTAEAMASAPGYTRQ